MKSDGDEPTAGKPRRPRRQNQRRTDILRVAAQLFSEKGYQATSIQDIADEADLLKGSLYYYFRSKQELLFEVANEAHSVRLDELLGSLDEVASAVEKVRRYVDHFVRTIADHPITTAAFYSEMRYLKPEHARQILEARDRYEAILVDALAAGQVEGSITRDAPPELLARGVLGLVNSIARWYQPDGAWGPDLLANTFADMVTDGVRSDG